MIYPIGIQDFAKLRQSGCCYVDKTEPVSRLVSNAGYYFLSRPRRFGKSLLLSTLRYYYEGRRELFKGLYIDSVETAWTARPVLYVDLVSANYREAGSLDAKIAFLLRGWEAEYGVSPTATDTYSTRFSAVIRAAHRQSGQPVAILVDEYDKPLLECLPEMSDTFRATLKGFYGVLKGEDEHIHFAMLTGVTKFAKVSVFSDLNKVRDISMDDRYSDICGVTEEELHKVFVDSVAELAGARGLSTPACYKKLAEYYDGYRFTPRGRMMYNPLSLLTAFAALDFERSWFSTGTPTFLVHLLQEGDNVLDDLLTKPQSKSALMDITDMHANPVPVIYQSGYLTIKDYDELTTDCTLDYPNFEVRDGWFNFLLPAYTYVREGNARGYLRDMRLSAVAGHADEMMEALAGLFDIGNYQVQGKREVYYQNVIYIVFQLLGLYVEAEQSTSRGRIDIVVRTKAAVYVIETKYGRTAAEALEQIEQRGYADKYRDDPRPVYKIGVNYDPDTRQLEYIIAEK